jgi:hypothetical protein
MHVMFISEVLVETMEIPEDLKVVKKGSKEKE